MSIRLTTFTVTARGSFHQRHLRLNARMPPPRATRNGWRCCGPAADGKKPFMADNSRVNSGVTGRVVPVIVGKRLQLRGNEYPAPKLMLRSACYEQRLRRPLLRVLCVGAGSLR
jgi:hypothetical protein